jgi:uncharacterized protein (TIGR03083 family)
MGYSEQKTALSGQGRLVANLLKSIPEGQWQNPSRLPGWDIHTLAAHTLRALTTLLAYCEKPLHGSSPSCNRVNYYNMNGPAMADGVTKRAKEAAAQYTAAELPDVFVKTLEKAEAVLKTIPPNTVILAAMGPIYVSEYIGTRVLELVVHGLDLQASLGLPFKSDPIATKVTVEILDGITPKIRPADLSDDIDFIEATTGRKPYPGLKLSAFTS